MQTVADNAIQAQAAKASYNGERLCVFTLLEMRSLLESAIDTSKSIEERKANVMKIFSQARAKHGYFVRVSD